ncbi:MAG: hypothetical protein R3C10_05580 [Pirellulales bacterium]
MVDIWPELPHEIRLLGLFGIACSTSAFLTYCGGPLIWHMAEQRLCATISGRSIDFETRAKRRVLAINLLTIAPFLLLFAVGAWLPDLLDLGGSLLAFGLAGYGLAFRLYADPTWRKRGTADSEDTQRDWSHIIQLAVASIVLIAFGVHELLSKWIAVPQ